MDQTGNAQQKKERNKAHEKGATLNSEKKEKGIKNTATARGRGRETNL